MYLIFTVHVILAGKKLAVCKGCPLLRSWAHTQQKHY